MYYVYVLKFSQKLDDLVENQRTKDLIRKRTLICKYVCSPTVNQFLNMRSIQICLQICLLTYRNATEEELEQLLRKKFLGWIYDYASVGSMILEFISYDACFWYLFLKHFEDYKSLTIINILSMDCRYICVRFETPIISQKFIGNYWWIPPWIWYWICWLTITRHA